MDHVILPFSEIKKAKPTSGADLVMIGSTGTLDRDGDKIKQAFDMKGYRKNPVVLWAHRMGDLPIGKAIKIGMVGTGDKKHLESHWGFVPEDIYPFAGIVKAMYEAKYLNASSIGFRPLKTEEHEQEVKEGLTGMARWFGQVIVKSELLEHSAVTVPANAEALVAAVDGKTITTDEANILAGVAGVKGVQLTALMRKELTDSGRVREALAEIKLMGCGDVICDGKGCACAPDGGPSQKTGGPTIVRTEIDEEAVKAAAASGEPIVIQVEVAGVDQVVQDFKSAADEVLDAARENAAVLEGAAKMLDEDEESESDEDAEVDGDDEEEDQEDGDGDVDLGDLDDITDEDFDEEDDAKLDELSSSLAAS